MRDLNYPIRAYELGKLSSLQTIRPFPNPQFPLAINHVQMSRLSVNFIRWHWHEEMELIIVESGTLHVQTTVSSYILKQDECLFLNQNSLHRLHTEKGEDCVFYSIRFHISLLFPTGTMELSQKYLHPLISSRQVKSILLHHTAANSTPAVPGHLEEIILSELNKPDGYELLILGHLYQVWGYIAKYFQADSIQMPATKAAATDGQRVKTAMRYIAEHHAEPLTLDEIAESIHISKSECCRCFKRTIGLSPFEFLMRHRILEAIRKMRQKEAAADTISGLAASVGFNSTSYFNKLFKRYTNHTPLEYRQKILSSASYPATVTELTDTLNQEWS